MGKVVSILKYVIWAGIFVVPFIPLVVSGSLFFPFITGKNFLFRVLVEILLGLWLILAVYDKRYRIKFNSNFKKSLILFSLILFILVLTLSSIFGETFYRSFWSNYERMEGLVTFLHLLVYFLILVSVLKTEKLWKWFFHISIGVSVIMAIYGFLQIGGVLEIHQSDVRLDATLGNASYLAIYMVFHIFLTLLFFLKQEKWYRWFYVPVMIMQTIILYRTETRGSILGFIAGILLLTFLSTIFSPSRRNKILAGALLVAVILSIGVFLIAKDSDFVKNNSTLSRFSSISLEETTTQSRFVIWEMSWEGFKEKPILGWGPENYNLVFNKYYEPILWKQEPWFDRAHSVFFDRLTTNGILGLLSYLFLFGFAFYYLLFKRKQYGFSVADSSVLTALLVAYFFHNLFVFDNLVSFILFFAVIAYIHSRVSRFGSENETSSENQIQNFDAEGENYKKHSITTLIVIIIIFVVYNVNVPALLASRSLLSSFRESAAGNLNGALENFKKAISYKSFGTTEAREHLLSFASNVISQPNIDQETKKEVFEFSSSEMEKQMNAYPGDIRYMIFLASIYNKAGLYDSAIGILQKAIELSPKRQQLYFELGNSFLNKGEYEKAAEVSKISFELETSYEDARQIYAISLIYAGNVDLAENLIEELYGTPLIGDQRFINAYNAVGQTEKVVEIWKKILEKDPNNVQNVINLAATYLHINDRENAIEQLEKAIELEPKFKQQGEYYINEIKAGRNP